MNDLIASYPSFLRKKPLIWGVSLQDLITLSLLLIFPIYLGISEFNSFCLVAFAYGLLVLARKIYPKRHFEFLLFSRTTIYQKDLNEKLGL